MVLASYKEHVVQPLLAVRDELFKTFRERPSIVSADEFEAEKASLQRMLTDFRSDTQPAEVVPEITFIMNNSVKDCSMCFASTFAVLANLRARWL